MYERDRMNVPSMMTRNERRVTISWLLGQVPPPSLDHAHVAMERSHQGYVLEWGTWNAAVIRPTGTIEFLLNRECAVVHRFVASTLGIEPFNMLWEVDGRNVRLNDQRLPRHTIYELCGPLSLLAWRATYQPQP